MYKVASPPPGGNRIKLLGRKIKWGRRGGEKGKGRGKREGEGRREGEEEGKGKGRGGFRTYFDIILLLTEFYMSARWPEERRGMKLRRR